MGFIEDIWTALLSDNADEEDAAVERITADPVASQVARSALMGLGGAPEDAEDGDRSSA